MKLTNYIAMFLLVLTSCDVGYSSMISGHVTEESHPMLASVFNVVDQIRTLQSKSGEEQIGVGSGQKSIAKAKPIVSTGPLTGSTNNVNHVADPAIDKLQINRDKEFPGIRVDSLVRPDVFPSSNTNLDSRAIELLTRPVITIPTLNGGSQRESMNIASFSADMWCSLCKQRGDKECIAIHCSNDGTSTIISGAGQPPLLNSDSLSGLVKPSSIVDSTLSDTMPVLDNNFGFGSQIDRHDLLQLTSVNEPSHLNVNDMKGLNQLTQETIRPTKETTAPIWLMADRVLISTSDRPVNAVPHMIDSSDLTPPTIAESLLPVEITREPITVRNFPKADVHPTEVKITKHATNPDIVFIDGNLANSLPMEKPQIKAASKAERTKVPTPTSPKHNINSQPLDVPTEIFLQMIRNDIPTFFKSLDKLQHASFTKPSNTVTKHIGNKVSTRMPVIPVANDVFAKAKPDNTFVFPTGFAEDAVIGRQKGVTTTTRIPEIPRAIDVFSIVKSDKNDINKQTLLIKDHGNADKVALHVGHGPISDSGISPLETPRHSSEASLPNTSSLDLHSLLHFSNDHHSHQSMDVKTTTDHARNILDQKQLSEDVGQNGNHHEDAHKVDTNVMDHKHTTEHSVPNANHQNSPMVAANAMHPSSILQHDLTALNGIHIDGGLTEEISTTTPIPTINPVRKAALDKFSEHLLSGIHV